MFGIYPELYSVMSVSINGVQSSYSTARISVMLIRTWRTRDNNFTCCHLGVITPMYVDSCRTFSGCRHSLQSCTSMASVCRESHSKARRLSIYGIPMSCWSVKLHARELLSLITKMWRRNWDLCTFMWDDGYWCRSIKRERSFVFGHKRFQPLLW
jgi:hypothetical protein